MHSKTLFDNNNKNKIVFKTDIKKFFESMDKEILSEKLNNHNIFLNGIPESTLPGLILSSFYSNIYLYEFDIELEKYCKTNKLVVSRYSDDIFVSTTEYTDKTFEISRVKNKISAMLKKIRVEMNEEKTKTLNLDDIVKEHDQEVESSLKITGVMVRKSGLSLPKRHSEMISAWIRKPYKYKITNKYIKNYLKQLKENGIVYNVHDSSRFE